MASYRAVNGVLLTLEHFFKTRMPAELTGGSVNATVKLLGSADIDKTLSGNFLGIYAHRLAIDPHGRSRFFPQQGTGSNSGPAGELPVNIHLLLIAYATSASIEANLMSWAMLALANESQFDMSHLGEFDGGWSERESITVTPEDLSADELMRIWDLFRIPYTSCVPYIARTLRLRLHDETTQGPAVVSRVFPTGISETK